MCIQPGFLGLLISSHFQFPCPLAFPSPHCRTPHITHSLLIQLHVVTIFYSRRLYQMTVMTAHSLLHSAYISWTYYMPGNVWAPDLMVTGHHGTVCLKAFSKFFMQWQPCVIPGVMWFILILNVTLHITAVLFQGWCLISTFRPTISWEMAEIYNNFLINPFAGLLYLILSFSQAPSVSIL